MNLDAPPIPTWRVLIATIAEATNALRHAPVEDGELADMVHIVRDLEKALADIRREHESEAAELIPRGGSLTGTRGGLESKPSRAYSFSVARVLADTLNGLGPGATVPQALGYLQQRGALQMRFLVSKLRPALRALDVQPVEIDREVEPDEADAHIGIVTTWKVERVDG